MTINTVCAHPNLQMQRTRQQKRDLSSFTGTQPANTQTVELKADSKEVRQMQNLQMKSRILNNKDLTFKGRTEKVEKEGEFYGTCGAGWVSGSVSYHLFKSDVLGQLGLSDDYNVEGEDICDSGDISGYGSLPPKEATVYIADKGERINDEIRVGHDFVVRHKVDVEKEQEQKKIAKQREIQRKQQISDKQEEIARKQEELASLQRELERLKK